MVPLLLFTINSVTIFIIENGLTVLYDKSEWRAIYHMEYTKAGIKKLLELISFTGAASSVGDAGALDDKTRELMKDENLELLCKIANLLESERKNERFSKRDTKRIAEETVTLFTVLKAGTSAADLETPVGDLCLPFDISCRLQGEANVKTVGDLLNLGLECLTAMDARSLLEIQAAIQRLILQSETE